MFHRGADQADLDRVDARAGDADAARNGRAAQTERHDEVVLAVELHRRERERQPAAGRGQPGAAFRLVEVGARRDRVMDGELHAGSRLGGYRGLVEM